MDGSMTRPFFVSFRVKWRWGPVDREPVLPVIPIGVPGRTLVPLAMRDWER